MVILCLTARIFDVKILKNQRNDNKFSKIAISFFQNCYDLAFTIIYSINFSLKRTFEYNVGKWLL